MSQFAFVLIEFSTSVALLLLCIYFFVFTCIRPIVFLLVLRGVTFLVCTFLSFDFAITLYCITTVCISLAVGCRFFPGHGCPIDESSEVWALSTNLADIEVRVTAKRKDRRKAKGTTRKETRKGGEH